MIGDVAYPVTVRLAHVVVPRVDAGDGVGIALRSLLGGHASRAAAGAGAVVGVASRAVEEWLGDAHHANV